MDVRELVRSIDSGAKEKSLQIGEICIGIGPINWVFRHHFPANPGLYWFYVDQPTTLSNGLVFKPKEVLYIGMTDKSIAKRFGEHFAVSHKGPGDHPWGAGEGYEFAKGTLFQNHEQRPRLKTQESADLLIKGQLWVGWFCLTAPPDDPNALRSLEAEMIAQAKLEDGARPFFNIID